MRMISMMVLSIAIAAGSVNASAGQGLAQETDINDGLLIAAVASKINRECSSISVRFFKARSFVNGLKDLASERGYSDTEIDDYLENKQNKAAMRMRRNAYYAEHGASNLDAESLCVLGHAEIDQHSQIGRLLRAK